MGSSPGRNLGEEVPLCLPGGITLDVCLIVVDMGRQGFCVWKMRARTPPRYLRVRMPVPSGGSP